MAEIQQDGGTIVPQSEIRPPDVAMQNKSLMQIVQRLEKTGCLSPFPNPFSGMAPFHDTVWSIAGITDENFRQVRVFHTAQPFKLLPETLKNRPSINPSKAQWDAAHPTLDLGSDTKLYNAAWDRIKSGSAD